MILFATRLLQRKSQFCNEAPQKMILFTMRLLQRKSQVLQRYSFKESLQQSPPKKWYYLQRGCAKKFGPAGRAKFVASMQIRLFYQLALCKICESKIIYELANICNISVRAKLQKYFLVVFELALCNICERKVFFLYLNLSISWDCICLQILQKSCERRISWFHCPNTVQ